MADRREWCGALLACARGNEVECNLPKGHEGKHQHIMADRREQRAMQRYLGRCNYEGTLHEEKSGCVDWVPDLNEPIGESSPGAEERATPQTETETPNVPKVMPNLLQVATRIREHFPASDGTDSLDAITIAKMISSAVGRAGVAATVETPRPANRTGIVRDGKGRKGNDAFLDEQPASEPTVTLEEAKAWRQVNWYDSVPQQLDEGLRAFAQFILRRKRETKEKA